MIVRPERDADRPRILDVVEAAFGKPAERILVERLWADERVYRRGLSLVAESKSDGVVGHVMVTSVWLDNGEDDPADRRVIASLAPPEAAQLRRLTNYDSGVKGRVVYPAAFDELPE